MFIGTVSDVFEETPYHLELIFYWQLQTLPDIAGKKEIDIRTAEIQLYKKVFFIIFRQILQLICYCEVSRFGPFKTVLQTTL